MILSQLSVEIIDYATDLSLNEFLVPRFIILMPEM